MEPAWFPQLLALIGLLLVALTVRPRTLQMPWHCTRPPDPGRNQNNALAKLGVLDC